MHTRPATPADIPFLRELHHRAYRDVVMRQFGTWDEIKQDARFEDGLREAEYSVIEEKGVLIGAFGIHIEADSLQLVELQILPEWQNKGLGSTILTMQIEYARTHKKSLRLRVLRENRARALYERSGFSITSETPTHYLMEWTP
jgi:GNAT superfamily N-acetyltransferase